MSAREAQELLTSKNGDVCARIYQRPDGTVLTEDCPVGVARYWRRIKTLVAGGVTAILFMMGGFAALGRDQSDREDGKQNSLMAFTDDALWQVKAWLGLNPSSVVMGKIAVHRPSPQTPASAEPAPKK